MVMRRTAAETLGVAVGGAGAVVGVGLGVGVGGVGTTVAVGDEVGVRYWGVAAGAVAKAVGTSGVVVFV